MKFKIGDIVNINECGVAFKCKGVVIEVDNKDPDYTHRVFNYDFNEPYWYKEDDLS